MPTRPLRLWMCLKARHASQSVLEHHMIVHDAQGFCSLRGPNQRLERNREQESGAFDLSSLAVASTKLFGDSIDRQPDGAWVWSHAECGMASNCFLELLVLDLQEFDCFLYFMK